MTELYIMQRYLRPSLLQNAGLQTFDDWASNFGEVVSKAELKPAGNGYRTKKRFAKFNNMGSYHRRQWVPTVWQWRFHCSQCVRHGQRLLRKCHQGIRSGPLPCDRCGVWLRYVQWQRNWEYHRCGCDRAGRLCCLRELGGVSLVYWIRQLEVVW